VCGKGEHQQFTSSSNFSLFPALTNEVGIVKSQMVPSNLSRSTKLLCVEIFFLCVRDAGREFITAVLNKICILGIKVQQQK
jgi:hypothetical protein